MKALLTELKHICVPLVVFLLVLVGALSIGISRANLEVILFKFLVFCPALILVHFSRRTLFPQIDITLAVENKRDAIVLGMIFYYVVMTYVLTAVL